MLRHGCRYLLVAAFLIGCSKPPRIAFPKPLEDYPNVPSNSRFDLLLDAASTVERACPKLIEKPDLTIGEKRAAMQKSQTALQEIERAVEDKVQFAYAVNSPLAPPAYRRGWRFLGNVLAYQLDEQLRSDRPDAAAETAKLAIRFGLAISGGDAYDANLGFSIAANACTTLWDSLDKLSPAALRSLFNAIRRAMTDAPSPSSTARNETANMLRAVQAIQDAFLSNDIKPLQDALGPSAQPAFSYLVNLKAKPEQQQVEYFQAFGQEAEDKGKAYAQMLSKPSETWSDLPQPAGDRPWKRFAAAYFSTIDDLPGWWQMNQARLRLLAIRCALIARVQERKPLPVDLRALPLDLRTDPFTGRDFRYTPKGSEFSLYSVGEDRRDDGGDGGPTGTTPDVTFER